MWCKRWRLERGHKNKGTWDSRYTWGEKAGGQGCKGRVFGGPGYRKKRDIEWGTLGDSQRDLEERGHGGVRSGEGEYE